ncbi:hypothetical protein Tco_0900376 [Tanacetum coccineum]
MNPICLPFTEVLLTYLVKCLGGNQGSHDQLNINQLIIAYALCWGLKIDIAGILYDDLISKLIVGGKKGRERNICYTRYLSLVMEHLLGKDYLNKDLFAIKSYQITGATSKQSSLYEVPLTSYMRQVAKLDEEPLITPSEEINNEAFGAMSLSGTFEHLVSEPKTKPDKKRRRKKIPSSSESNVPAGTTQSLDASMSAEELRGLLNNEKNPKVLDLLGVWIITPRPLRDSEWRSFPILQTHNEKNPKSLRLLRGQVQENIIIEDEHIDDEPHDAEFVDSRIQSMDDMHDKPSLFTSVSNEESDTEEDSDLALIPDDEVGSPSTFQTLKTDEDYLSEPLLSKSEERDVDHVLDEIVYLQASPDKPSDTLSHLQEEITSRSTKVDQMESNITRKVSEEIQSSIPALITEALKQQLPGILIDSLNSTLPKPLNKELNAFNKLEANRFFHLQEELSMVIQKQISKKVKAKVRTGMSKVTERLDILLNSTKENSDNISEIKQQMTGLAFLLQSAKVLKKTNAEGEKCENSEGTNAQEEQGNEKPEPVQGEQQSNNQESVAEKVNINIALIIHALEEKGSEEKTLDEKPLAKRLKVLIPTPKPLRSIFTEPPKDPTPPRDKKKGKGIATEEEPLKQLLPMLEQGGSDPKH